MNKLIIIGNVVHMPETKTTPTGINVTTFQVAVNLAGGKRTDYFRVTAWRGLADTCALYVQKGKKVCVVGDVTARAYTTRDGEARCQLEVNATEVEFLSPRDKDAEPAQPASVVFDIDGDDDEDDLPFV